MKDITLGKSGQISLIAYVSTIIVPLTMGIIPWLSPGFPLVYMNVGAGVLVILYVVILYFGIKELSRTKFPLLWLIPCFVSIILGLGSLVFQSSSQVVYSESETGELTPVVFSAGIIQKENGEYIVESLYYPFPAESTKLLKNDTIKKIDGKNIQKHFDSAFKRRLDLSEVKVVTIGRDGKEYEIDLP